MPMNLRIDLKIIALEPQPGGLTLIEGLATDGTSVVVTVRVAEPLAVGGWMTMALLAEPAAAQPATAASMRERMQVRASGLATASAAPASRSATAAGVAAPAAAAGDASSLLLSSILGNRGGTAKTSELFDNSPLVERNVDDEMDALFGAPPRKG
jgi:hypothetical protein